MVILALAHWAVHHWLWALIGGGATGGGIWASSTDRFVDRLPEVPQDASRLDVWEVPRETAARDGRWERDREVPRG